MDFIPAEIIKKKRAGKENTDEEIQFFVNSFSEGQLPDYQMAAWIMAICFQGMSPQETATLTQTMKHSGDFFDFSHLTNRVDKHSTGGVGDKASLILGPIAAAAGVHVPMIAGRGLGHTGGTLDKLESLNGFNVNLKEKEFSKFVSENHIAIMGQTEKICPADRKLYALRDVTGTVESLPLICGSIMSKKLAEDLTALVLDVKFGTGAFMKTEAEAEALARLLVDTGTHNNVKVNALITNMNQPLGRFIGNSLEVHECIEIMENKSFIEDDTDFYAETRDLSILLAGYMIYLSGKVGSAEEGLEKANEILTSGKALNVFKKMCQRQGTKSFELPKAKHKFAIISEETGYVSAVNTEKIGLCAIELGAGRKTSDDKIDHSAGIEVNFKIGQMKKKGEVLAYLYGNDETVFEKTSQLFMKSVEFTDDKNDLVIPKLLAKVIE